MKASEIRSRFLKFFEKNGHTVVESSSLVPANDPTLLFTNAGMNQFKDVFLGNEKRLYSRAATAQKCVRAGGKHNDLENVGFTARHHTFFEMLGNFSFGDYFKKEAIHYAWKFVTEELKLPQDKLFVSVFESDDEAADIWHQQEKLPKNKIYRFGEKDNFWQMGDTGPCGPCSEIFIDRGPEFGDGTPETNGDRYMEFWNLVFMQFNRDEKGKLHPLPKPSVDTGAGLERLASILQNAKTNYDTDVFQEIIQKTAKLAKTPYVPNDPSAVSFRVIADHSRAAAFLISDGVMPSNEGRGYVLRRILRRAIRHGKKLGLNQPFMSRTSGFVIDQMRDAYPSLNAQRSLVERAIQAEEEQFLRTLENGLKLLDEETSRLKSKGELSGAVAFKLYDTYGFPIDLTRVICEEKKLTVDESGFEKEMEQQRARARASWKGSGEEAIDSAYPKLLEKLKLNKTIPSFVGYDRLSHESECIAVLPTSNPKRVEAVFLETPFYGESGGQVGDRGRISGNGFDGIVVDVKKPLSDLIVAVVELQTGHLETGKKYRQDTNAEVRALTARNHTATHLLHWALREVLGSHVKQAGSLVTPDLLRFDFSHFQAMKPDELLRIEDLINEKIWKNEPVEKKEMPKESALKAGAIAFFGEKYGDRVRVVSVGDYSVEFCGGTHVDRSSDIHLFKIVSEAGIAAGVRRIIAYTSKGAFEYLRSGDQEIKKLKERLQASSNDEVLPKLEKIIAGERELRKQLDQLQAKASAEEANTFLADAQPISGGRVCVAEAQPDSTGVKKLRELADTLKQRAPDIVAVLGMRDPSGDKAFLLAVVGPKADKKHHAGNLIQTLAPLIDGRGGGKADLAQAGGTRPSGLQAALQTARETIK